MTRCAVIGSVIVALVATAMGQTFPVRLYGGGMDERAYALTEGVDNGFCLAGWTRSFGPGTPLNSNVVVVKTDPVGNPLWVRTSIGMNDDEAYSMVKVADGYVLCGWTRSYGFGAPTKDIFVAKLDPNGVQQWGRVYGGFGDDDACSICATSDGGFAITGLTASYGPHPMPNFFVLRLDPMGQFMWFNVYWGQGMQIADEGHSIIETPDMGFAVCGRLYATVPMNQDAFLLKLDPMGHVMWMRVVPGEVAEDNAWSVAVDQQYRILVGGYTYSYGTVPNQVSDLLVAAFQMDGSLAWSHTYGWPAGDEQALDDRSLVATVDGGSAICGLTTSFGPGVPNPNFLVVKLDQNGAPQWVNSHPSPYWPGLGNDVPLPMIEQAGGGYAVAGYSNSWPLLGGGEDLMLSTFDQFGNRPVCSEPQPVIVDTLPWIPWPVAESAYHVEQDSMPLHEAMVLYDSVCYDTTQTGIDESRVGKVGDTGVKMAVHGTRVELELERGVTVSVSLLSTDGRVLANIAHGELGAGRYTFTLPRRLPAGACILRAEASGSVTSTKVVRF